MSNTNYVSQNDFLRAQHRFYVDAMTDRKIILTKAAANWRRAHEIARNLVRAGAGEYARIRDPKDASVVDFITKERLARQRRNYRGEDADDDGKETV